MRNSGSHQQNLSWLGEYEIISKIGDGTSATVYKAKSINGSMVSIKVIKPSYYKSKLGFQLVQNEIKILKSLSHKHILSFITSIEKADKVGIITSYCDAGDLQKYLAKHKKLGQKQSLVIMKKVAEACVHLKKNKVIHRDIKLANIFIHESDPVIADFGFSLFGIDNVLSNVNAGSPMYMPIQSLKQKLFSQKSDIFAFGVCLFELLSGKTPWTAKTETELIQKLKSPPTLTMNINERTKKLILQCLSYNADARPTFEQVLQQINYIINNRVPLMEVSPINVCKTKANTQKLNIIHKSAKQNKKCTQEQANSRRSKCISMHCYSSSGLGTNFKNQTEFLNSLQPQQFRFLPQSVIIKFKIILHQYKKILGIAVQQDIQVKMQDALVEKVQRCSTELQLCLTIQNFIRRLFRLSKNYSQFKKCHQNIGLLQERVTSLLVA